MSLSSAGGGGGSPREWELLVWHQQRDQCLALPKDPSMAAGMLVLTQHTLVGLSQHTSLLCQLHPALLGGKAPCSLEGARGTSGWEFHFLRGDEGLCDGR